MVTILAWAMAALALPLFLATGVLVVEIVAALLPVRKDRDVTAHRPACAVLIPAHNEEAGITRTLAAVETQLRPGDRVVVVADNCSDRTADVARAAGATVVERQDSSRRGKGYALDCGVGALKADTPAVVVILDADCVMLEGSLDRLVHQVAATGRPAQAAYTMEAPATGGSSSRLAAFLFTLKNTVRPRGLARIGMPCLLTGTGMAFPWHCLRSAPLASGNIVEDMQLGIDLAIAGQAPVFCARARVRSELPCSAAGAASQRTRWVHGHLRTLATQTPRLLAAAIRSQRPGLLGLALELSVPPLSALVLAWLAILVALTAGCLAGGPALPLAMATAACTAALFALLAAWWRFGREHLSAADLLVVPMELASRLPILFRFLVRPQAAWVRTARRAVD
jgi:cellulose synthase/poly-beta-1,6-N-acetylglucosamine synthase-like glycosyltransferase